MQKINSRMTILPARPAKLKALTMLEPLFLEEFILLYAFTAAEWDSHFLHYA